MLRSDSPQGQVSLRQALTAATTGGHGYMKRCHDKMRSELLSMTVDLQQELISCFHTRFMVK